MKDLSISDKKVCLITLGCPKNDADSEVLWGLLRSHGMQLTKSAESADVIFINTCGFIEDAKQESINAILSAVALKMEQPEKKLYVWGCLSKRYKKDLIKEIPQVDMYFGVEPYQEIERSLFHSRTMLQDARIRPQRLSTPAHTAYLKISDGCSHTCTFCAIPLIKGKIKSRPADKLFNEAQMLASQGVRELILIGQDTTAYGYDLGSGINLSGLIRKIAQIDGIEWIRIMYAHPANITTDLIETIAEEEKVCKYLDLPLQHISDSMLKRMGRDMTGDQIRRLIERLRSNIPDIVLRTAFITGFPGETEEDFNELLDFVNKTKFERLGCFVFSPEQGTAAYKMEPKISKETAVSRHRIIMESQMYISEEINPSLESTVQNVIVDGFDEHEKVYFGRTQGDCPEIDQTVWIQTDKDIQAGDIIQVVVDEGLAYDLIATY